MSYCNREMALRLTRRAAAPTGLRPPKEGRWEDEGGEGTNHGHGDLLQNPTGPMERPTKFKSADPGL